MHLTNIQIENFVKAILPCLEYAAFVKQRDDFVPLIIRLLAFLSPGIIVPFVLDLVYPFLQTITEPHRLTQSLKILSHICVVIACDRIPQIGDNVQRLPIKSLEDFEANKRSYRRHAIILMNNLLPGLDVNDVAKCGLVFQILSILMTLVPIVDCSQAPLTCKDLTPEEIDLCSETASFEFFVEELMRKIFSMIMLLGGCVTDRQDLTSTKTVGKNVEEIVIEKCALIVFRALVKNCSSAFYKQITDQYYNFVNEHLFNSKPTMDTITKMFDPHVQFPRFFTFAVNKFEEHYHVGCEDEEDVDRTLIWYISFASEIVRNTPGLILLENRSSIDSINSLMRNFIDSSRIRLLPLLTIYAMIKRLFKFCGNESTFKTKNSRLAALHILLNIWDFLLFVWIKLMFFLKCAKQYRKGVQSAEQLSSSPKQSIEGHSGVLALAAIVLAFPYSVPSFLPKVLMHLCSHATEPQPIYGTVKRALSEFKVYFFLNFVAVRCHSSQ